MNELLSTKQVKKLSGFSYESLYNYKRKGWIPEPKIGRYDGRGSSLFWPRETLMQLSLIKSLKKSGYKNEIISQILKGDI
jgi:DNA-binding transcriptional MerR regulator